MKFKSPRIEAEWNSGKLSQLLRTIVETAAARASVRWDWEFVLTCVWRSPDENEALTGKRDGVHVEWRGVDVRTRLIDPQAVTDVSAFVNDRWKYDPERPLMKVCIGESEGPQSSAAHLHFQSHPHTCLTRSVEESTIPAT